MKFRSKDLLDELAALSSQATAIAQSFLSLSNAQLHYQEGTGKWSILQCLEHLNLYGDYYLPEMEREMMSATRESTEIFTSGLLGNYFADAMRVQDGHVKKMKSPRDKEPSQTLPGRETIERFLAQQQHLEQLLQTARTKDLNKIRVRISLNRFVRIRLGDTLRFYIFHIERHLLQAKRIPAHTGSAQ